MVAGVGCWVVAGGCCVVAGGVDGWVVAGGCCVVAGGEHGSCSIVAEIKKKLLLFQAS